MIVRKTASYVEGCVAMDIETIARETVDCGFAVHTRLGPGLFESAYEMVLAKALERRGLNVERQKAISFTVDGMTFTDAFRADLVGVPV